MIKFFRKMRQGLLTENKFSKYLIYAIGEIVLVVIGILIALQINNWNENQKHLGRQVKLIYALILDMNEKMEENIVDLRFGEHMIAMSEKAIDKMKSGALVDATDVKELLRYMAMDTWFYVTATPTYNSIVDSDLWQQLPDTIAKKVQGIYDHKSTGVKIGFEKATEYATHCRITYLAPNEMLDPDLKPTELSTKINDDAKAFRVHLNLFMNGVYRLNRSFADSRDSIEELIPNLISYRDDLAKNAGQTNGKS